MKELTTPIKTGVIGLGRAGWNIHIKRMRNDARFQVSAVSDFETEWLSEASGEFGCEGFRDYHELLAKADCELVVVASQSVGHARHAIDILASGRHAIVEKPMAFNIHEAACMIETAEIADRHLFSYQSYCYQPDVRHIQEIIAGGLLCRVFEICIRWPRFERRNDWQTLPKYGGGCLNNT